VCCDIFFSFFLSILGRRSESNQKYLPSLHRKQTLGKKRKKLVFFFFFFVFFFFQSQSEGGVIFSLFNSRHRYKKRAYLSLLGEEEF